MTEANFILPRKNFDLEINEQFSDGITGIYGPSGSGKTSILHAIAGLAKPTSGKISIGNRVVYDRKTGINIPVQKRDIGYVFQEGRLFPHLSVEKNLRYGLKKNGANKVNFDLVVDLLKLNRILKSKPSQISGGERQRTALGRSLLSSPGILLLDEPFSAVDARHRSQIIPFLLQIHREIKIPMLVVSHDLPDLLKLSNSICVIKNGKCLGNDDYFQLMKSEEIARIFGSEEIMNSIRMQVEKIDLQNNLTILRTPEGENRVRLKTNGSTGNYTAGQEITFYLNADDIALSVEKPEGITIQNQLKGTVTDLVNIGSSTLCQVDVGFKLTAEITTGSLNYLNIEKGSKVWCLFKSVAIDVAN